MYDLGGFFFQFKTQSSIELDFNQIDYVQRFFFIVLYETWHHL